MMVLITNKYPLPENVNLVIPAVNSETWGDMPYSTTAEAQRLRPVRKMTQATLVPMLQVCSTLTTAVDKGKGFSQPKLRPCSRRWQTPAHWLCSLTTTAICLKYSSLNPTSNQLFRSFATGTALEGLSC